MSDKIRLTSFSSEADLQTSWAPRQDELSGAEWDIGFCKDQAEVDCVADCPAGPQACFYAVACAVKTQISDDGQNASNGAATVQRLPDGLLLWGLP